MRSQLGFTWDKSIFPEELPGANIERACFRVQKLFPEFVWDTTELENNPFTFPEIKTLLEGITVGGRSLSDEQQVLNQAASWKLLLQLVKQNKFTLTKSLFCKLNAIVAQEESLSWGKFRDGDVSVAGTRYKPPSADQLEAIFQKGLSELQALQNPTERGLCFFLFGALQQFFYDGNKRTSRLMMNGVLLSQGLDAISIPGAKKQIFNEKMIRFYDNQDATEMMQFLLNESTFNNPA